MLLRHRPSGFVPRALLSRTFPRAIALVLAAALAPACYQEPKAAAKRPSEVPIDTASARREAKRPDPDEGVDVTTPPPDAVAAEGGDEPGGGGGGGGSGGGRSGGGGTSVRAAGGGGNPGGKLTKGQCDQMIDRYVELVISSGGSPLKGTAGKDLENARNMIKSMVSQDPNFQGFQRECLKNGTRGQHACAMAARDAEEYRQCIR